MFFENKYVYKILKDKNIKFLIIITKKGIFNKKYQLF